MKLVLSLWPHIQTALASPWSNIRSICYGLVCSMLKINISDYQQDDSKPVLGQQTSQMTDKSGENEKSSEGEET